MTPPPTWMHRVGYRCGTAMFGAAPLPLAKLSEESMRDLPYMDSTWFVGGLLVLGVGTAMAMWARQAWRARHAPKPWEAYAAALAANQQEARDALASMGDVSRAENIYCENIRIAEHYIQHGGADVPMYRHEAKQFLRSAHEALGLLAVCREQVEEATEHFTAMMDYAAETPTHDYAASLAVLATQCGTSHQRRICVEHCVGDSTAIALFARIRHGALNHRSTLPTMYHDWLESVPKQLPRTLSMSTAQVALMRAAVALEALAAAGMIDHPTARAFFVHEIRTQLTTAASRQAGVIMNDSEPIGEI